MDAFTYTISDGHGETDTATVTMTIGGENDPPNAVNDIGLHVAEGAGATALGVLVNDDDPDDNDLTIVSVTSAAHGTVTITGNGTGIAYRPAKWFHGTDQFMYTVDDGHGDTDHATVQVIVDKDVVGPVAVAPLQRLPGQTLGTTSARVRMSWSASDPGSGVTRYLLQVSVNGGTFKTVKLPKATTSTIDQTLAYGRTYRFRVKAYDHEGNIGAYAYGPTFRLGRYEESNRAVAYVGAWSTIKRAEATSGAARYTGSGNRTATLDTIATDVAAGRDPHAGQWARAGLPGRHPGRDRQPGPLVRRLPAGHLRAALRDARAAQVRGPDRRGRTRRARRLHDPALTDPRLRLGRGRRRRRTCYTAAALSGRP